MNSKLSVVRRLALWRVLPAVAIVLAVVALVVWRQGMLVPKDSLHFWAESANGITRGMAVKLKGFPVGHVASIEPKMRTDSREIKVFVTMLIDRNYMQMVPSTAKARLRHESLVGQWAVELVADQYDVRPAANGEILQLERSRGVEDVSRDLQERLTASVDRVGAILGELQPEAKKVGPLLDDARELVLATKQAAHAGKELAHAAAASTKDIAQDAKHVLTGAGQAMDKVNESLPGLIEQSRLIADEIKQTAASGRKAVERSGPILDSARDAAETSSEIATGARKTWPFSLMVKPPSNAPVPFDSQDGLRDIGPQVKEVR